MTNLPELEAHWTRNISVLCADPSKADRNELREIFDSLPWGWDPYWAWSLTTSSTVKSAERRMRTRTYALVLCGDEFGPGVWHQLCSLATTRPDPPVFLVTSRLADDHLWAEALNLGAYDVLAKPFDRTEVRHVLGRAWMHWVEQCGRPTEAKTMTAGSGW